MRTFAKHFTQGYVGKIKEVGTTLKISISSSYRQRNRPNRPERAYMDV